MDDARSLTLPGRAIAYGPLRTALVCFHVVMAGLVPTIHVVRRPGSNVDARDKPGHDGVTSRQASLPRLSHSSYAIALPSRGGWAPVSNSSLR